MKMTYDKLTKKLKGSSLVKLAVFLDFQYYAATITECLRWAQASRVPHLCQYREGTFRQSNDNRTQNDHEKIHTKKLTLW